MLLLYLPMSSTYTLSDDCGLTASFTPFGATWLSAKFHGRELLLGHANVAAYATERSFLGCMVGRYANRIAGSRYVLDGQEVKLPPNEGPNLLHGGSPGYHLRDWTLLYADNRELRLKLHSPDGDQGFPGALDVELSYRITGPGEVRLSWTARCSKPCPVNLTNHSYFNLDGTEERIDAHRVRLEALRVLPVDWAGLPKGEPEPVNGTRFDLREWSPVLGPDGAGYDHCFIGSGAQVRSGDGRVQLDIGTSLPGLQYYTGRHLTGSRGRTGRNFPAFAGFAIEPQYWPDSPNHPGWPSAVVRPGEVQAHHILYRFSTPAA